MMVNNGTARGGSHPVVRALAAFPIACFCVALVTDTAYWWTANVLWADFSAWLLAVGMAGGVLAAVAAGIDWLAHRRQWRGRRVATVALGCLLVLVLGFFDNLVHTRDAWTSVVPWGATLSAATVFAMLATAWLGASPRRQPTMDCVQVTP